MSQQVEALAKMLSSAESPAQVFVEFVANVLISTKDPAGSWLTLQEKVGLTLARYLEKNRERPTSQWLN